MKSLNFVYGRCSLNLFFIFLENNLSINVTVEIYLFVAALQLLQSAHALAIHVV